MFLFLPKHEILNEHSLVQYPLMCFYFYLEEYLEPLIMFLCFVKNILSLLNINTSQ